MMEFSRIAVGMSAVALLAGCQQSSSLSASDVMPSKFIQGLLNQQEQPGTNPNVTAVSNPAPVETVVLPPSYSMATEMQPTYVAITEPPAYVESSLVSADVYEEAPQPLYQQPIETAYTPEPIEPLVSESVIPLAALEPIGSFPIEPEFVAADPAVAPVLETIPAPTPTIVQEPVFTAALPETPSVIVEPSEALAIEVDVPESLDGIAPPPILEADLIPQTINDAPVDAPVLPSTEILESELAPLASEADAPPIAQADAPPRPVFTPIPQPGLADYGSAF